MSSSPQLNHIFADDITRNIEGVIKADDDSHLAQEVREYVITREVERKLSSQFFDAYSEEGGTNGVWISGFFGSGKSHLLKMLSLLLENREIDGASVSEQFAAKAGDNALLEGQIRQAARIPARSILFNIDSKADVTKKGNDDAVLAVFMSVFNQMQGYYRVTPWLADLERDLDESGLFTAFREKYAELHGASWEDKRHLLKLGKRQFAEAYAAVAGGTVEEAKQLLAQYNRDHRLTIELFAERVAKYIEKQPPGFRLNFFVDEVGQYIGDNTKLMTNLQTIAENLFTKCDGRAWVFVTSQEEIKDVVGGLKDKQSQDFSKIQARFGCKLNLSSQNVDEVIQLRLLRKNEAGRQALAPLYEREHNNFATLLSFSEGGTDYPVAASEEEFVRMYPFQPYHFGLLQECIRSLSRMNALSGKHASVGERSLLSVFQDVVKQMIRDGMALGQLPTFDRMFDGIQPILKGEVQASLNRAVNTIGKDSFEVKVLKVLFLVRYVNTFTATPRHIAALLVADFDLDPKAHLDRVKTALNDLVRKTFILRNGEEYQYLTDDEKDIESEIKDTGIERTRISRRLATLIFDEIVKDARVTYKGNDQRFDFNRVIDTADFGRNRHELTLHVVTPLHPDYDGGLDRMKSHSMDKPEIRYVLPPDDRILDDIELYEKTDAYVKQHRGTTKGEKGLILQRRGMENATRMNAIINQLRQLMREADIVISGEEARDIGSGEPRNRVAQAMQQLIERMYYKLNLLPRAFDQRVIQEALTRPAAELLGESEATLGKAEKEMMTYIGRQQNEHRRVTPRDLIAHFGSRPYGWSETSTLTILARLLATNRVEGKSEGSLKSKRELLAYLTNSSKYDHLRIEPLANIDTRAIKKLKDLHQELFGSPNAKREAKEVALEFQERLREEQREVDNLYRQRDRYPFLGDLEDYAAALDRYLNLSYADYYTRLPELEDELLEPREDTFAPIREFMRGERRKIYDDLKLFLDRGGDNIAHLDPALITPLREALEHNAPYRGGTIPQAKTQLETAKRALLDRLDQDKQQARTLIDAKHSQLTEMEEFADLTDTEGQTIAERIDRHKRKVDDQQSISGIAYTLSQFEDRDFPALINKVAALADHHRNPPQSAVPSKGYDAAPSISVPAEEPKQKYTRIPGPKTIANATGLDFIKEPADIDAFLAAYRKALSEIIDHGHGIYF